jgi:hypothetical protein
MKIITLVLILTATTPIMTGCHPTPAQQAEINNIETVVLADVQAGKTYEQIVADVAQIVAPGTAGTIISTLVNDALQFLVDAGVLSAEKLLQAKAMLAQHTTPAAAAPATSAAPAAATPTKK